MNEVGDERALPLTEINFHQPSIFYNKFWH